MEEKKLTDDEIVKALGWIAGQYISYIDYDEDKCKLLFVDDILDLIHRLQVEIDRLNDMKFTQEHCDLYKENERLKAVLKRELADHEAFTKKANEEIERLTAKYRNLEINYNATWEDYRKYEVKNAELQKQVDELKAENAILNKQVDRKDKAIVREMNIGYENERQTVKDTAKEIFEKLLGYIGSQQQFCIVDEEHKTLIDCDKLFDFVGNLAKEKGVEVE
jgi:chromosome segregation ATPase